MMNRLVNRIILLAGALLPGIAVSSSLPAVYGKWQCVPERQVEQEESWVTYDFQPDGTMQSQEWVRYQEEQKTWLEFNLFVNYRFVANGNDYMLKPVSLNREIITDPTNVNPFDYSERRDLTGYRIFFKPTLLENNRARFDMWYHITPDNHFIMQCQRQNRV